MRPLESDEDLKYLFHSFNDQEAVGKFVNYEPRSWEHFQLFVRDALKSSTQLTPFLIERLEDKKVVGTILYFVPHPLSKACLEIGYGIDFPELRRKGYASEAAGLFVDFLFSTKPLERLQATTSTMNTGSQRVLEKLGFSKEGVLRKADFLEGSFTDIVIYSLLREEWGKRQIP